MKKGGRTGLVNAKGGFQTTRSRKRNNHRILKRAGAILLALLVFCHAPLGVLASGDPAPAVTAAQEAGAGEAASITTQEPAAGEPAQEAGAGEAASTTTQEPAAGTSAQEPVVSEPTPAEEEVPAETASPEGEGTMGTPAPAEAQTGSSATVPETEEVLPAEENETSTDSVNNQDNTQPQADDPSTATSDDSGEGVTEDAATDTTEEVPEEEEEPSYPAQSFSAQAGFLRIEVMTDEGTFPENTTMKAVSVSKAKAIEAAQEAIDADPSRSEEVVDALAVDITFYNEENEEIQPVNPGGVHVTLTALREIQGETQDVAHMENLLDGSKETVTTIVDGASVSGDTREKADGTAAATNVTASFDAEHFSVYAIIGTSGGTPRRTYIFYIDQDDNKQYDATIDELADTQTVKNGDELIEPGVPSLDVGEQFFKEWVVSSDSDSVSGITVDDDVTFGIINNISGVA